MTKIKTLNLEYDIIEIHYNPKLKNKPYLVRVFNYNNNYPDEFRLNEEDVKKNLYQILKTNKKI
jgi:hypothetical protein